MKTETEIKELLSRALTNDRQALAEILNEYGPKMFYETRLFFYDRKAAKEVEQNALRAAFSKLREAADADNVDEWFSDFVEKEALKNILPVDDPGEQYDDYTETDELVTAYSDVPEGREECMAEILKVLDALPADERTAAVLHFYKHLSVYETAAKMGISAGGVRTLLTSAKARIHQSGEDLGTFISAIDEIHPDSTPPSESTLKIESFVQNPEEAQPTIMVSGLQEVAEAGQTKPFAEKEEEKKQPVFKEPEPADVYDDYDEDDDEDDINKLGIFLKIFFTVLILGALACGAYYWFYIRTGTEDVGTMPVVTETETPEATPEVTETPEPTPTPTPEVTEEPDDGTIGTLTVIVNQLNVRSGPGTNYRIVKTASSGEEYDVYDVSEDGTYTWYQIDEDQWVADANGGMVTYVEK